MHCILIINSYYEYIKKRNCTKCKSNLRDVNTKKEVEKNTRYPKINREPIGLEGKKDFVLK
ncbi:hypothetical protein BWD42_10655 [Sphingobacterium sp. CZ-UAM]|nr:hypothetical protein BWD42_10655 [Sphingobacterium sp. CZ-UAM]